MAHVNSAISSSKTRSEPTTYQQLQISLLGEFSLRRDGRVYSLDIASHQSLLAYVIIHPRQVHSRRQLAYLLWPDSSDAQALTNLRKAVYTIRQSLPDADEFLAVDRHTVQWRRGAPCLVDVWEFETAAAGLHQETSADEQAAACEQAVSAYPGDFLPGHYEEWILATRERYRQQYLVALEEAISLYEEQRQYPQAINMARRLLQTDPLHEAGYRRLMRLHSLNGNVAGALRAYHACSTRLQRDLGVDPGPLTRETYERLLRVEAPRTTLAPSRLPLVARETSWQKLQGAWRQCSFGRSSFVLLSGEAGIGKTRLAEELLDWAERQGIATMSATCYAAGGSLPYAPAATWLRGTALQNLAQTLPDKWLIGVSCILPELAVLRPDLGAPAPITEDWQRQHLFAALAHAVLGRRQPFLLYIDDLQWCDPDTLQWLDFLLHFDPTARFLLLGAVRTEEVPADHPLNALCHDLRRDSSIVEIELGRLDRPATVVLARHITGQESDDEQAAGLYSNTEGVPLFIVEMTRAGWRETGDSAGHDGRRARTADQLPHKVQAMIQARLEGLTAEARELTELSATIGRFFTFDLLSSASGMSQTELVRALDEMWQQRIVREQGDDAYDFSHDKLRQVAYASLSAARRRRLHGRVITALEAVRSAGGEVDNTRLGEHYAAAGRQKNAAACFRRAATQAQQLYAYQEALANLQRALALRVDDDNLTMALHEQCSEVQALVGHYDEAREALAAAQAHAMDSIDRARILRKLGDTWNAQRHFDRAGQAYDDALAAANQAQERRESACWWDEWMNIELCRGELLYYTGHLPALAEHIAALQSPIADHASVRQEHDLLNLQSMYNIASKRFRLDEGDVARSQRQLALTRQTGNAHQITFIQFSVGFMYLWSGSPSQAVREISEALQRAEESGNLFLQDQSLAYLTLAYRRMGDNEQVRKLIARHHPVSDQVLNILYRGVLFGCEAWVSIWEGDMEAAIEHGQTALETWGSTPFPLGWVALWPLLAASLKLERLAEAVDYATRMLDQSQQRLADDITAELSQAVGAWEASETAVSRNHLLRALQLAQETHTF